MHILCGNVVISGQELRKSVMVRQSTVFARFN